LDLLARIGGLEIAALAGFYATAAGHRTPFIVDGAIACAALCVADRLSPGTANHAIAGHRSAEPAAGVALDHLGLGSLLDLDLRLGEGTGACLAFPLVRAAAAALAQMAAFPEAP
ncbi:MAG: nicotinate-nucleotide--dimethylbenzimidazole phosphoribosyltransferase, partial [Acidimicrobiia bacterium]|nr:nicotinate-nucleotide--dimethylbenzimidazole phosphoribosyltransferase [Acidimicrobiia bacterium]